ARSLLELASVCAARPRSVPSPETHFRREALLPTRAAAGPIRVVAGGGTTEDGSGPVCLSSIPRRCRPSPEPGYPAMLSLAPLATLGMAALLATEDPQPPSGLDLLSAMETAVADAIEDAQPSVVAINRIKSE